METKTIVFINPELDLLPRDQGAKGPRWKDSGIKEFQILPKKWPKRWILKSITNKREGMTEIGNV